MGFCPTSYPMIIITFNTITLVFINHPETQTLSVGMFNDVLIILWSLFKQKKDEKKSFFFFFFEYKMQIVLNREKKEKSDEKSIKCYYYL